jgi:tetratricopeptide (TPR) repeat protein
MLCLPAWAAAEQVEIRSDISDQAARVVLVWQSPVSFFETSTEGRELLIRFDRHLEAPKIDDLPKQAPKWIEGISTGFDTMLLRASRDVNYQIEKRENEIIITMTPAQAVAPLPAEAEAAAQSRLDLLEARLLAATGREAQALESLRGLAGKNPTNTQMLSSLASLEHSFGRWRRADALYQQALAQDPTNEELIAAQAGLRREQAPRIHFETDRKMVSNLQREQIQRLSGHTFLTPSLRAGFTYDQNFIHASNLLRPNGEISPADVFRQRGEISLQNDYEDGSIVRGALLAGPSGVGLGFRYARPDTRGQTSFVGDWQRPYWEYIETVVNDGTRDRVEIRRQHRLAPRLLGTIAAALNRYGLDGDRNVATTFAFDGNLSYTHWISRTPLTFEYYFDGESRRSIETRTTAEGLLFNPLPLVSREVHSVAVMTGSNIVRYWRAEGFMGYAWDRLGGRTPFFGGRVNYEGPGGLGAAAWYDRRLYAVRTNEKMNRIGGYIFWRF